MNILLYLLLAYILFSLFVSWKKRSTPERIIYLAGSLTYELINELDGDNIKRTDYGEGINYMLSSDLPEHYNIEVVKISVKSFMQKNNAVLKDLDWQYDNEKVLYKVVFIVQRKYEVSVGYFPNSKKLYISFES